jgi:hypothetical protein
MGEETAPVFVFVEKNKKERMPFRFFMRGDGVMAVRFVSERKQ